MRIYLSPENRISHVWGSNDEVKEKLNTNEAYQMQKFSLLLKGYLERAGYEVFGCDNSLNASQKREKSNEIGVDLHIPLHTNGTPGGKGPEVFYSATVFTKESKLLSGLIFEELYNEYKAFAGEKAAKKRDHITKDFEELREIKTVAAYIEIAFHDNDLDIEWMQTNWDNIAQAITRGINYYVYGVRAEKNNAGDDEKLVLEMDGKPKMNFDNAPFPSIVPLLKRIYWLERTLSLKSGLTDKFRQELSKELELLTELISKVVDIERRLLALDLNAINKQEMERVLRTLMNSQPYKNAVLADKGGQVNKELALAVSAVKPVRDKAWAERMIAA